MVKLFYCFLLSLFVPLVYAEPKYPVDISYMVSDFKYSQKDGLKICEVQQGFLSALNGDRYVSGGDGNIPSMIAHFFDDFSMKKWVVRLNYQPLKNSLIEHGWEPKHSIKMLSKDPAFLKYAMLPPLDPFSIASYAGIVYATRDMARDLNFNQNSYPGILFIDAATLPYWVDKYKMNSLFNENAQLKEYKADWELHPKKYDPLLAGRIQESMPSELYVIKPRGAFLGNGVIVVANKDLDSVLQQILQPQFNLKKHPDKSYSFWWGNKDDTFLIEKHYTSDCLQFAHRLTEEAETPALSEGGNYHYDATMRLAFILRYDRGHMTFHCLGGFWKLPCKALEEEGTLNEKRVSYGEFPFYRAIDPQLLEEVSAEMERAMLLLYNVMLYRT